MPTSNDFVLQNCAENTKIPGTTSLHFVGSKKTNKQEPPKIYHFWSLLQQNAGTKAEDFGCFIICDMKLAIQLGMAWWLKIDIQPKFCGPKEVVFGTMWPWIWGL